MTEVSNTDITKIKFFKMDEAINASIDSKTVFIIANETKNREGRVGRFYTVFPSFKHFLASREKYSHCHEILVNHKNNIPNNKGRLVFDFDIKGIDIPKTFKKQIESTIYEVIERYFTGINPEIFEYVWSTSQNPDKFSKHLTVKNLYFDNWLEMSRIFYKLFSLVWDETNIWIDSRKLIDAQIVRNRASLRMVGSSKINGYPLTFDNDKHLLTDSLIRIYLKTQREKEQLVTKEHIKSSVFENVIPVDEENENDTYHCPNLNPTKIQKPVHPDAIYKMAFTMVEGLCPGVFKPGKVSGQYLVLLRQKPNRCLMSNRLHEAENAFLIITLEEDFYVIKFGCYRFCSRINANKTQIGCISANALIPMFHPNFEPKSKVIESKVTTTKKKTKPIVIELI
jgi:hypothetical protein